MLVVICVVFLLLTFAGVHLLSDYERRRLIRFRVVGERHWQIAFNQDHLNAKLAGRMAEVIMPARPLCVRLWRKVFPPQCIEMECEDLR